MKQKSITITILILLALCLALGYFLLSGEPAPQGEPLPEETAEPQDPAEPILKSLSLEEKVGQMFFIRCPVEPSAVSSGSQDPALTAVETWNPGGLLLFGNFFEEKTTASAVKALSSYQQASSQPLLIGVDEEGGDVVRISKYPAFREKPFASPQELYTQGGLALIVSDTHEKNALLQSLGVNVNFAPVCDISTDPGDYIYGRTFGDGAVRTAAYVRTVVAAMKEDKMGSVLKHFPGYGGNADTHEKVVKDTRAYETFAANDFIPFIAGLDAGAGCVLMSHNIVTCLDETLPASLSPAVHRELRENFLYDGPIITDDLDMDAIAGSYDKGEAAVAAVLAGNDLICTGSYEEQIPAVILAVREGRISEEQIDRSVHRILTWKAELGLI